MPPCPVQQWRAIGSKLPYLALLRKSFYLPIKKPSCPFATVASNLTSQQSLPESSSINNAGKRPIPDRQSVIVSHSVHNTTPEDIIAHIKRYSIPIDQSFSEPLAIFLLTPSFAKWLLDDETFLRKALQKVYGLTLGNPEINQTIHTLVAVVDRLPAPSITEGSEDGIDRAAVRVKAPPVAENGYEGIAYALADANYLPSYTDSQEMADPLDGSPSTITLHKFLKFEDEHKTQSSYINTIQIPLANTIFHTGYSATMFSHQWKKSKGMTDINLEKKTQLKHLSIHWPDTLWDRRFVTLSIPLVPLTVPRCIEAGMGNIIRRVLGSDQKSMTASQELEETVPQYFSSRGTPPHSMTVWALVIPQDIILPVANKTTDLLAKEVPNSENAETDSPSLNSLFLALWRRNPPGWNDIVWSAVTQGARLHRVLSGGGGWGKKAGLLSLDPDMSYNKLHQTSRDSALETMGSSEGLSALYEVAKPGEFIQFFVSPSDGNAAWNARTEDIKAPPASTRRWSLEFGTISSSIDSIPESSSQETVEPSNPRITVFRKHFGALSEGGMSIARYCQSKKIGSWDAVMRSKVDVPYSRFSAVRFKYTRDSKSASGAKASRPTDDSQKLPIHKIESADHRKNPSFSSNKSKNTQDTRGPKSITFLATSSDETRLNEAIVLSVRRARSRAIHYHSSLKGGRLETRMLRRKLKDISEEYTSLRREFAIVLKRRRLRDRSQRGTTAKLDAQPNRGYSEVPYGRSSSSVYIGSSSSTETQDSSSMSAFSSSTSDQLSSTGEAPYGNSSSMSSSKSKIPLILGQANHICRDVGFLHICVRKTVYMMLERLLKKLLAPRMYGQDGLAVMQKQVRFEGSEERLPAQEIVNAPVCKANIAKTKYFVILLEEKIVALRDYKTTLPPSKATGFVKDVNMLEPSGRARRFIQGLKSSTEKPQRRSRGSIVRSVQIEKKRDVVRLVQTEKKRDVVSLIRKKKRDVMRVTRSIRKQTKGDVMPLIRKVFRAGPQKDLIRKHVAIDSVTPELPARRTLSLPQRIRGREQTTWRSQSPMRAGRMSRRTLDPEAQKLADEVERWLKGF